MNLVIIGLKPSVLHENNRNMFVVIFVGQASYNSAINVMKYAQNIKKCSWKDGNEINECSLFYLFVSETIFMPTLSQFHGEKLSIALGSQF